MHLKDKLLTINELKNQLLLLADSVTYSPSVYVSDSTSVTINYTRSHNQSKADGTQVNVLLISICVSLLLAVLSLAVMVIWMQQKRRCSKMSTDVGKLKTLFGIRYRLSIKNGGIRYNGLCMIISDKN